MADGSPHHDGSRHSGSDATRDGLHWAESRQRRMRSIAIALALLGLVAMFYAATLVRLGANVFNRAI